jgi:hypothetical protein
VRWTSAALAAAVAAGVGAIVATVWVGSRVREDTVVANPYEEGLRLTEEPTRAERACDLSSGPCTLRVAWSGDVTLELSPRPLRTMVELQVRAVLRDAARLTGSEDIVVAFSMVGMEMGKNEVRLARAGGAWVGTAVLVRCPSGRRDWVAEVRVGRPDGFGRAARFPFTVSE